MDIYIKTDGAWNKASVNNGSKLKYLNKVILISFTIAGTSYQAEEGMTWNDWVASIYNTDGFAINDLTVVMSDASIVAYNNSNVIPTIAIISGAIYTLMKPSPIV